MNVFFFLFPLVRAEVFQGAAEREREEEEEVLLTAYNK